MSSALSLYDRYSTFQQSPEHASRVIHGATPSTVLPPHKGARSMRDKGV